VSGYSASLRSTLPRQRHSLLTGDGRKEGSNGDGKENFYSCAGGKQGKGSIMEKKG